MADSKGRLLYTQEYVEDIADAIRALKGTDELFLVSDMAEALSDVKSNRITFIRSYITAIRKRLGLSEGPHFYAVAVTPNNLYKPAVYAGNIVLPINCKYDAFSYGVTTALNTYILGDTRMYFPSTDSYYFFKEGIRFNYTPCDYDYAWATTPVYDGQPWLFESALKNCVWCREGVTSLFDGIPESHPIFYNIYKDGGFHSLRTELENVTLKDFLRKDWYNLPKTPSGFELLRASNRYYFNALIDESSKYTVDDAGSLNRETNKAYITSIGYDDSMNHTLSITSASTLPSTSLTLENFKSNLLYHTYDINEENPANCTFEDIEMPERLSKFGEYMEETFSVVNPTDREIRYSPTIGGTYLIVTTQQPSEAGEYELSVETTRTPIYNEQFKLASGAMIDVTYAKFIGDDEVVVRFDQAAIDSENGINRVSVIRISGVNTIAKFYGVARTNYTTELDLVKDKMLAICIASCVDKTAAPYIRITPTVHENSDVSDISYVLSESNFLNSQIKVFVTENADTSKLTTSATGGFSLSATLLFSILG